MNRRLATFGLSCVATASMALVAEPASAAQVKTHVVVEKVGTAVSSLNLTVGDVVQLTTHMDGKCLSAVAHAKDKSFGIAPSVDAPSVASLTPTLGYAGLNCDSPDQTWTVTALSNGDTTLYWTPVVTDNSPENNNGTGLQGQMGGAAVQVHVGTGGTENPPGHGFPAAPAVANSHVPRGSDLAGACKTHYSDAKNWHGLLIKEIAKWARDGHYNKLKHTYNEADWLALVTGKVDAVCHSAATT